MKKYGWFLLLASCALSCLLAVPAHAGTYVLYPVGTASPDAIDGAVSVVKENPDANYFLTERAVYNLGAQQSDVYLRYDLSVIGEQERISSVVLVLASGGSWSNYEGPFPIDVYFVPDSSWSASAVTWNTRPALGVLLAQEMFDSLNGNLTAWDLSWNASVVNSSGDFLSLALVKPDISLVEVGLGTISLIVTTNIAPVAADQAVSTFEDAAEPISLGAADADGHPLTYALVTAPAHGILGGTAPNLTYFPTAGFHGSDSFTFKANDGRLDSNVALVSITVTAVNHAPVAAGLHGTPSPPRRRSRFPRCGRHGDPLSYAVIAMPAHGTLSGTLPNLTYQPAAGFSGLDSFTFIAHDGGLPSNTATVSITVTADAIPPTGSVLINNGAASTNTNAVTLNLSAVDTGGSGLDAMRFGNGAGYANSAWERYQPTKAWTLASGTGTKTVYVQFRDRAGRISDADPAVSGAQWYQDTIVVSDTTPPTNGTVTVTAVVTQQLTVSWSGFADAGSGIASYRVVFQAGSMAPTSCNAGTLVPGYAGAATTLVHAGLVNGRVYSYRVCAIDRSGYMSTGRAATSPPVHETNPPATCEGCHNGNPNYPLAPNVMGNGVAGGRRPGRTSPPSRTTTAPTATT